MNITDEGSIGTLVNVYTTSVSTVLICEAAPGVVVTHWKIYIDEKVYGFATNVDSDLEIRTMYYRLLELDRDTEYEVCVKGMNGSAESAVSNTITFKTFPA